MGCFPRQPCLWDCGCVNCPAGKTVFSDLPDTNDQPDVPLPSGWIPTDEEIMTSSFACVNCRKLAQKNNEKYGAIEGLIAENRKLRDQLDERSEYPEG